MAEPQTLPEHVTTPLLTLLTQRSLDEDYQVAAERRAATGAAPEPRRGRVFAAAVIAVFGVLVTVAAVQTSRNEEVSDAGRAVLVSRIQQERADLEAYRARIADLTRENRSLNDTLAQLSATRQQTLAELRQLQLVTGYLPATGGGVRIVVNGNPTGDEVQQVTDADLAMLVNGLWEAGAEAVAINGQRLNPLGSIRNVGSAIHVNTVPLSPPYTVRAIGDTGSLQADLLNTTHGAEFFSLADQLGFEVSMQNVDDMTVPASRQRRLLYVKTGTAEQRSAGGVEEGQP